jgi:hypothetical protein
MYSGIYYRSLTKFLSRRDGPAVKPLNSIVGLTIKVGIE